MDRRMRRSAARAALVAALAATLTSAAVAASYVTTDLTPWNLTETLSTYGGNTEFHISTGTDGWVAFRWLESPTKITVVSANACPDWSLIGNSQTIGAGDTAYHSLFQGFAGQCFVMRGRTASGQGSMSGKDGRVRR
jgi:opacity protein-like surface antigen